MAETITPSALARQLVQGAYDLHVYIAPDVIPRRITGVALARRFAAVGMAGFVLKSQYVPTAERAAVVRKAVPGANVLGALVLTHPDINTRPTTPVAKGRCS